MSTRWQARGVWHDLAYAHTLHIKGYYFALGQFQLGWVGLEWVRFGLLGWVRFR